MKLEVNTNDLPDSFGQSPKTEQRQIVRTKIIGDTSKNLKSTDDSKTAENTARKEAEIKSERRAETAKKANEANIDRVTEMRHLRYEVITEADIVQVSVINSEDGTIIRKVPPDKVVNFAKKFKEKRDGRRRRLDVTA